MYAEAVWLEPWWQEESLSDDDSAIAELSA